MRGRVGAVATAHSEDPELCRVEQFIQFENVAISLAEREYRIETVQDLADYRVLAWERAYQDLGDEFFQLFAPQHRDNRIYLENHSQEAQVKMFWLDRADVLVIDKVIFEWYRKQLASQFESHRNVQYHPVFDSPTYYPALFRDQGLCDDFRVGLEKLKSSGRYQALYDRYIQ
jgi:polar amino acid transport system substrate-binding protein